MPTLDRRRQSGLAIVAAVLVLAAALVWQLHGRAHQAIDLGSPLDDGTVAFFYPAEQSTARADLNFRWSEPEAALSLSPLAPGHPAALRLRMLALDQPDRPQQLQVTIAGRVPLAFHLDRQMRTYQLLIEAPPRALADLLSIQLSSPALSVAGDPRRLGVALDRADLDLLGAVRASDLLSEWTLGPYLPLGVLLVILAGLFLGLTPMRASMLGAGLLLGLVLVDRMLPGVRLQVASLVAPLAAVVVAVLLLMRWVRALGIAPTTDRRARGWILAAFALMLVITFIPSIKSDGMRYYAFLRSTALDHDLHFENEFNALEPGGFTRGDIGLTPTGYTPNNATVGPALIWAPLFVVAHILAPSGHALGLNWAADGYSLPYIVLVAFSSALAGLVTMLGCYTIIRRWVAPEVAAVTVIALVLGSNLLYYMTREGSFSHALSAASATLLLLAWLRLEDRPSVARWAVLGVTAGLVVVIYWVGALVVVLPALTWLRLARVQWRERLNGRAALRALVIGPVLAALLALAVFSPQMVAWWIVYGSPIVIAHGNDYVRPGQLHLAEMLFSHLYGLLPWTPAFFIGLIGLPLLLRRSRWLGLCLLGTGALYLLYNASLARWFAGGSFGLRRLTLLTPWFAIGMALFFQALQRLRRELPLVLSTLMATWTTLLLVRYDLYLIPHSPEKLQDMSPLAFYFSRDLLPTWALPYWLQRGFLEQPLYGFANRGMAVGFVSLVIVMILATVLVVWLAAQIGRQRHAIGSAQPQRRFSLRGANEMAGITAMPLGVVQPQTSPDEYQRER